jgi:hypothetical protein
MIIIPCQESVVQNIGVRPIALTLTNVLWQFYVGILVSRFSVMEKAVKIGSHSLQ